MWWFCEFIVVLSSRLVCHGHRLFLKSYSFFGQASTENRIDCLLSLVVNISVGKHDSGQLV